MKKFLLSLATVCLLIVCIFCSACDGLTAKVDKLTLQDFYEPQNKLVININAYKVSNGDDNNKYFELGKGDDASTLREALLVNLPEGVTCRTQTYDDILLFTVNFEPDKTSYFMLRESEPRDEKDAPTRYCLSNMAAHTLGGDIIFPYHLCPDARQYGSMESHFELYDDIIEISLDYDACKQFYLSLGRDDITFDDSAKTITLPVMDRKYNKYTISEDCAARITVGDTLSFEKVDL